MHKLLAIKVVAVGLLLSACSATLQKDVATRSGYISYPKQYAPPAESCQEEGVNGRITRDAIDSYLESGWPDDAKILASYMNGEATESQSAFARKCLGWDE